MTESAACGSRQNDQRLPRLAVTMPDRPDLKRVWHDLVLSPAIGTGYKDGNDLGCFRAVNRAGATRTPIVSARKPEQSEKIPALKWVNTVLGNLKTAISGTHKAIRRPYVGRYFAEFQFRFNGRHDLPGLFTNLLTAAAGASPQTYADIRLP